MGNILENTHTYETPPKTFCWFSFGQLDLCNFRHGPGSPGFKFEAGHLDEEDDNLGHLDEGKSLRIQTPP